MDWSGWGRYHSLVTQVVDAIRERIRETGPVPFAIFMEEALYGEGGYYARAELPIGRDGDFVTGSSHSPLFGQATARLLASLDPLLDRPAQYLEAGYGGGEHLAAVVAALRGRSEKAGRASRRIQAWDRVERPLPKGVAKLPDPRQATPGSIR